MIVVGFIEPVAYGEGSDTFFYAAQPASPGSPLVRRSPSHSRSIRLPVS